MALCNISYKYYHGNRSLTTATRVFPKNKIPALKWFSTENTYKWAIELLLLYINFREVIASILYYAVLETEVS